ncbi:MAG: 50S ribosomal protein L29 [Flavobacteriaceae bacterium]
MKQSEINNLSLADLQDKLAEFKKQLEELSMAHAITPLENPLQIRGARRTVARLQTAITQRQQEA